MIPGSTVINLFFGSKSMILFMCFETSTTMPSPTHCPANEVPPDLGIKLKRLVFAKSIISLMSDLLFGKQTAMGCFL